MERENKIDSGKVTKGILAVRLFAEDELAEEGLSENRIKEIVKRETGRFQLNPEEENLVARTIMAETGHTLENGILISAEHKKWVLDEKKNDMPYTKRYLEYLKTDPEEHLPIKVVRSLDETTDEIMDCLGDPKTPNFKRYGIVMGEVQSGKTGTYAMLSDKAVDTGYQIIILLTGTTELLRKQTQGRMDRALTGIQSDIGNDSVGESKYTGVGKIGAKIRPEMITLTSVKNDFRRDFAAQLKVPISDVNTPFFVALKKNKNILRNLQSWLRENLPGNEKTFVKPMLLIDDEADNASVNVSSDPELNSTINRGIKGVLSLFDSYTYVGFTATPFANIFIDPDKENDLYPHDFIYCLSSPSNYVSPESIFCESGANSFMIRDIPVGDNGLKEIPYKHSKELKVESLPVTLIDAINCYVMSCAVRDLRGQTKDHMSMLINVSRFTNIQEQIKELVSDYLYRLKNSINAYAGLDSDASLKDPLIKALKDSWNIDYQSTIPDTGITWDMARKMLPASSGPIVVRSVNQKNGPKNLDYEGSKNGLRVMAIGGNSLSRGLTLEGLCISYFYRRSESYDTLMQMGRWFGYRDGYADLCRIWMTSESRDWYDYIAKATAELRIEFEIMRNLGSTPDHFGFRVRNDIRGLLVTARNKMRHAQDAVITKCISGEMLWTSRLDTNPDRVDFNDLQVRNLARELDQNSPGFFSSITDNRVWRNVPRDIVVNFLLNFKHPAEDTLFDVNAVKNIIEETPELEKWVVAIQHGTSKRRFSLSDGVSVTAVKRTSFSRKAGERADAGHIRLTSSALVTPENMIEGLCIDDIADGRCTKENRAILDKTVEDLRSKYPVKSDSKGNLNYPANAYLKTKKRQPIMLIYPVDLGTPEKEEGRDVEKIREKNEVRSRLNDSQFPIGIALGFPAYRDENDEANDGKMMISYKTTAIYARMRGNEDLDEEE